MTVNAATIQTYDNSVLREDLAEQYSMISPEECPFQTAIGQTEASTQPHHEWSVLDLQAVDNANRVAEGEDNPAVDPGDLADRRSNYTQISDKMVKVSQTSEASDAAAEDVQRIAKQIALKIRALKRDMETMLLQNVPADPGAADGATVRQTAGMPAFLFTNTHGEAGGADPTLSGTTTGYPDVAAVPGTVPVPLTEDIFNDIIQSCWENGGAPNIAMVNANNKRVISETFTGTSTKYKDAIDKQIVNAVDIYDSDFGVFSIVPNRFQPTIAASNYYVLLLDPEYAGVSFLETVRQKPLAETGHSKNRLVWCEYALQVDNEGAHGIIRDTNGAAA